LTKVGGNTVGDSVVWSEVGQELGLSKQAKEASGAGSLLGLEVQTRVWQPRGRMVPKNSSCANAAELANHLTRGVAGNSGVPDAARSAAVGLLEESLCL